MSLESTSIFDRRVYAQDSAPSDTRDGVIWVDTGSDENDLYTYDADSSTWVLASPSNIAISDTQPADGNLGDGWIDTSADPPAFRMYDGAAWRYSTESGRARETGTLVSNTGTVTISVTQPIIEDTAMYTVSVIDDAGFSDINARGAIINPVTNADGTLDTFDLWLRDSSTRNMTWQWRVAGARL